MIRLLFIVFCLLLQDSLQAQLTLFQTIEQAKKNSYTAKLSANAFKIANLDNAQFKLSFKPSLSFYGNVPVFNKDNYAVTQPDGSIKFLSRSQNYSNVGIGFSQPIPFTDGTIAINTDLYRFDDFVAKTKQYNGTPVFVRLTQPLFKYNAYKWNKQIENFKLQEADKTRMAALLQLEYDICLLYFDVIDAQTSQHLALNNGQNIITNLAIERRRVQLGVSTEDKVLQLEMQQINNQQELITVQLSIRKAFSTLQNYINSTDTSITLLQLPENLPVLNNNKEKAIEAAKQNLPLYLSYQRKKLEAASRTEEARMQGRQIDLVASFGLNNAATDIPAIYQNPQDQQRFSIGFNIPIVDWGRRKSSVAAAKLQEEQTDIYKKQDEAKLINEISNIVNELPVLQQHIQQSLLLDTLSQRRFAITNRLFQSGKTSLLELQTAQTEKDNAKRNYILTLRRFWESYYFFRVKMGDGN